MYVEITVRLKSASDIISRDSFKSAKCKKISNSRPGPGGAHFNLLFKFLSIPVFAMWGFKI